MQVDAARDPLPGFPSPPSRFPISTKDPRADVAVAQRAVVRQLRFRARDRDQAPRAGCTGHSDQRFVPIHLGPLESDATVIALRLVIGSEASIAEGDSTPHVRSQTPASGGASIERDRCARPRSVVGWLGGGVADAPRLDGARRRRTRRRKQLRRGARGRSRQVRRSRRGSRDPSPPDCVAALALDAAIAADFDQHRSLLSSQGIIDPPEDAAAARYEIRHISGRSPAARGHLGLVTLADARTAIRGVETPALVAFLAARVADARAARRRARHFHARRHR